MGKVLSTVAYYCPDNLAMSITDVYNRRKEKRKRESESNEESELMESLHVSKRMKLQCTAQYIYQTLFVDGKDSDITVHILNRDWKLHKVYLGQSQYFSSMFSGSWNETNKTYISIEVEDPNITNDALSIVFGSFYLDEVKMEPCSVVGVMAAATMFQMDGLIEQCHDVMVESVSPLTAVQYYQAACDYGLKNIKEKVLNWFLINLTEYYNKNVKRLKEIDLDLMEAIVSHPNLNVIQTEMSLYCLLKKWLYLHIHPYEIPEECNTKDYESFFRQTKGHEAFLLTEKGSPYINVFKNIRVDNLILSIYDIPTIMADGIFPDIWLLEAYKKQWLNMLEVFSGNKGITSVDETLFFKNCYRCGRIINEDDAFSWRWSSFSFGIDLIWTLAENTVTIKRQRTQLDYTNNVTTPHHVLLKVELYNLDERKQVTKHADSGILNLALTRNQEVKVLSFEEEFEYPIYFVVKLLVSDRVKRWKKFENLIKLNEILHNLDLFHPT